MKRTIIHTSAAIALLLGIAACTQDEAGFLQEGAEGTPIVFTATGLPSGRDNLIYCRGFLCFHRGASWPLRSCCL